MGDKDNRFLASPEEAEFGEVESSLNIQKSGSIMRTSISLKYNETSILFEVLEKMVQVIG